MGNYKHGGQVMGGSLGNTILELEVHVSNKSSRGPVHINNVGYGDVTGKRNIQVIGFVDGGTASPIVLWNQTSLTEENNVESRYTNVYVYRLEPFKRNVVVGLAYRYEGGL